MRRLLVVEGDEGGVEEDDAEDEGLEVCVLHLGSVRGGMRARVRVGTAVRVRAKAKAKVRVRVRVNQRAPPARAPPCDTCWWVGASGARVGWRATAP